MSDVSLIAPNVSRLLKRGLKAGLIEQDYPNAYKVTPAFKTLYEKSWKELFAHEATKVFLRSVRNGLSVSLMRQMKRNPKHLRQFVAEVFRQVTDHTEIHNLFLSWQAYLEKNSAKKISLNSLITYVVIDWYHWSTPFAEIEYNDKISPEVVEFAKRVREFEKASRGSKLLIGAVV